MKKFCITACGLALVVSVLGNEDMSSTRMNAWNVAASVTNPVTGTTYVTQWDAKAGLTSSPGAITSAKILLWDAMTNASATATGGTITTNGGYIIHTFLSNGTFTVSGGSKVCNILIVAGGASAFVHVTGGGQGGGAGGGCVYTQNYSVAASAYNISVGDGGPVGKTNELGNGSNSVAFGFTAFGGGLGGDGSAGSTCNGLDGGCGGGGGGYGGGSGGNGTNGQGYVGGNGSAPSPYNAGGGGGAGGSGSNATVNVCGVGGPGLQVDVPGAFTNYFGGGGGGGAWGYPSDGGMVGAYGGSGGGGRGSWLNHSATAGIPNTGGGSGGGGRLQDGALGGKGVVFVWYATP